MPATSVISDVVGEIGAGDHLILFYDTPENKRRVLFDFLQAGLREGSRGVYISTEESPEQIQLAMEEFGIDARACEERGSLILRHYDEWYFSRHGRCLPNKILAKWAETYDEAVEKGLSGLSAAAEMSCFFKHRKIPELLRYENALHRNLQIPAKAICAYSITSIVNSGYQKLLTPLIQAHGRAILTGPGGVMLHRPDKIKDADIARLLQIEIQ